MTTKQTEAHAHIQLAKLLRSMTWAELNGFAADLHDMITDQPVSSEFEMAAVLNGWAESEIETFEHRTAKEQTND